ncbi:hypothetical protein [Clostridium sp. CF012]|uniref:XkdQ/YqbQ family protein n=1 Tax=Clostridium sp. CF012 TaxID=2843319 RepID=UPI001C0D51D0|nr:hypothetical protein [Clostridium sp. CF012]MBU3146888.1 hypothetical protein [Clostridium sp. CF012]
MIYTLRGRQSGIWVNILPTSDSISWGSDKDTLAVDLSFTSLRDLTEGTIVQLLIDSKLTIMGSVIKKSKTKNQFSYSCQDFARVLGKNETIIQFNKISASDAIKQLCSKFGVKCNVVDIDFVVQEEKKSTVKSKADKTINLKSGKTKVTKRVVSTKITTMIKKIFKDQTLSDIIEEILEQATSEKGIKYVKEMIGDTLYIRKLADYKIFPTFILASDLSVNSSIEEMKNKILVVSSDEKNNRILATASDPKNINIYGSFQEVITVEQKDMSKASNIATNRLKETNKVFKDTTLNIIVISGGEEIRANRMISLKIASMGLNGWYNIKSCSNSLQNGNFKSAINIEW